MTVRSRSDAAAAATDSVDEEEEDDRFSIQARSVMTLESIVGADVETGGKPWDPLGLGRISELNGLGLNPNIKVRRRWW
jgi:hypothetical protein